MTRVKGITLIELMITLLILSILVSIGIPQLSVWLHKSQTFVLQNKLIHTVNFARSSAISLQQSTTFCPGLAQCQDVWGAEAMVFVDLNLNAEIDGKDYILKHIDFGQEGEHLDWKSFRRKNYLQFGLTGRTKALNGSFHYCNRGLSPDYNFKITVSKTGRIRISEENTCSF